MKAPKSAQKVFRIMVVISIILVIVLTAAAGVTSYLIASQQDKQSIDNSSTTQAADTVPKYRTSALILVQIAETDSSALDSYRSGDKVDTSDITSSVMLANTCAMLFMNDPDMKALISGAEVEIAPVEDSYFLRITSTSTDPYTAANVANLVANAAPSVYKKYFGDSGKVSKVDEAMVPSQPIIPKSTATAQETKNSETLHIVLIASLAALSATMLLAILLTAAVYGSQKKKYERIFAAQSQSAAYPAPPYQN